MLRKIIAVNLFLACAVSYAFAQNYKIKQVTTISGQKMESTVYVKGSRKRTESSGMMGMGGDVADVEQCDLKRNLKISVKKRMYAVEPFDDGTDTAPSSPTVKTPKSKVVKGGTVTYISNITDTGERKQMFGLTARHVKTSMTMQASPDACSEGNFKVETDGWYVDLPQFSCPLESRANAPMLVQSDRGGCQDKIQFKTTGGGKLGFALTETRSMNMGDTNLTQTLETLDFSKATLDNALFDIPNGYTLTANSQDLYGKPDISQMMRNMGNDDDDDKPKNPSKNKSNVGNSSMPKSKKAGTIRIGVLAPTNRAGEDVSTTNLQSYLIQKLTSGNVEAVGISSEADAQSAECDFILTSDFSKLKQSNSSKIGGMFGKVTNTDTSAAKNFDAQIDFKLVATATGKTIAQSKANAKGTDVDRTAEDALSKESEIVLSAAKK